MSQATPQLWRLATSNMGCHRNGIAYMPPDFQNCANQQTQHTHFKATSSTLTATGKWMPGERDLIEWSSLSVSCMSACLHDSMRSHVYFATSNPHPRRLHACSFTGAVQCPQASEVRSIPGVEARGRDLGNFGINCISCCTIGTRACVNIHILHIQRLLFSI